MKVALRTGTFILIAVLGVALPVISAPKPSAIPDELKQNVEELRKNPGNKALREKIIKTAAAMKKAPALPEDAQRSMARGTTFAQRASDTSGYLKAIKEFEAAINSAPWLGLAYYNLGVVQEMAGQFNQAIESLKLYLLASPNAKNARDVKNKIYALEAEAEAVQAGMAAPDAGAAPEADGKAPVTAGGPNLEIEGDNDLRIIKLPQEKKAKMINFAGSWYFKESIRGEEVTIHAFDINKNANGDLALVPPKRAADSYATINMFEIADKTLKLQMKWKMRSVVGYWKTETYVLTMSEDGQKMNGSHNQKSVGGRNIDLDRVLFRQ